MDTIQKALTINLKNMTYQEMKEYKKILIDENISMGEDVSNFIKKRIRKE